jgi:glycosyltransferase involved in cell wall biosynthesis
VFDPDGKLMAYANIGRYGNFSAFSQLIGMRNNDGIMHLLMVDIVSRLIEQKQVRYVMYDTFFGAQPGLQQFKRILGFQPYRARTACNEKLINRLYADYLMPSRMGIRSIAGQGRAGRLPAAVGARIYRDVHAGLDAGKVLVHRHDIDSDLRTARKMFALEVKHGIRQLLLPPQHARLRLHARHRSRRRRGQLPLRGSRRPTPSATGCAMPKRCASRFPEIRELFARNLNRIEDQLGLPMTTVASHGDFANRSLKVINHELLRDDQLRRAAASNANPTTATAAPLRPVHQRPPYPQYYHPMSPFAALGAPADLLPDPSGAMGNQLAAKTPAATCPRLAEELVRPPQAMHEHPPDQPLCRLGAPRHGIPALLPGARMGAARAPGDDRRLVPVACPAQAPALLSGAPRWTRPSTASTTSGIATPPYRGNGVGAGAQHGCLRAAPVREAGALARNFEPDVVIASSTYPLDIWPAHRIARLAGARLLFELHDLWPLSPMELGGYSRWHPFIMLLQAAENFACRRADAVVSILPKVREHLEAHGMAPHKLHMVPNGADPGRMAGRRRTRCRGAGGRRWRAAAPGKIHRRLCRHPRHRQCARHLARAARWCATSGRLRAGRRRPGKRRLSGRRRAGLDNVHFFDPVPKDQVPALLRCVRPGLHRLAAPAPVPLRHRAQQADRLHDGRLRPILHAVEAGNDPVAEAGCGLTVAPETRKPWRVGCWPCSCSRRRSAALGQRGPRLCHRQPELSRARTALPEACA